MTAYYNEIDPYAAQWLRNLIDAGEIAPGVVDERSIEDVRPSDLDGFTQCHFFAGIGIWSYALRQAGFPDDRPVWTGSCPCQPFSAAGKGAGFADERHLWPAWFHLISQCRPSAIFGEQVASKDAMPWIDLVQDDMEALDYSFGAVPLASAGFGAPHIRERLYWVADNNNKGLEGWRKPGCECAVEQSSGPSGVADGLADSMPRAWDKRCELEGNGRSDNAKQIGVGWESDWLADTTSVRRDQQRGTATAALQGQCAFGSGESPRPEQTGVISRRSEGLGGIGWLDNHISDGRGARRDDDPRHDGQQPDADVNACGTGPTNGHWRAADWLLCRDGKWRPVEPGTSPLAARPPNHVGRLRAYGNAITAQVAQGFIEAYLGK